MVPVSKGGHCMAKVKTPKTICDFRDQQEIHGELPEDICTSDQCFEIIVVVVLILHSSKAFACLNLTQV